MNEYVPLLKDMNQGQAIFALVKGDDIEYIEGKIISVGPQRVDMMKDISIPRTVVDITYELKGTNYTDVININDSMFSTKKPGFITLVSSSKDIILKEIKASLKIDEDFIEGIDNTIAKKKNNIEQYKDLILKLDTEWAKQQAIETRITSLENNSKETNILLKTILDKLG